MQASQQPGVSMVAVAMAHGINANLLRRWVHERAQPPADTATVSTNPVDFIALPMPTTACCAGAYSFRKSNWSSGGASNGG